MVGMRLILLFKLLQPPHRLTAHLKAQCDTGKTFWPKRAPARRSSQLTRGCEST
jgi:hypothetical protein